MLSSDPPFVAHFFLSSRGREKGKGKLSRSTEILDKVLEYQIN